MKKNTPQKRKWPYWIGMTLSLPLFFYSGLSTVYFAWRNAATPEEWSAAKASAWVNGAILVAVICLFVFIFCLVSVIKKTNSEYRIQGKK